MWQTDEEAVERWKQAFNLSHVAIADPEIAEKHSFRVTKAIPRQRRSTVSRTWRCAFLNGGDILKKIQVGALLLKGEQPREAYPGVTPDSALHFVIQAARRASSKRIPEHCPLKDGFDAIGADVDTWCVS